MRRSDLKIISIVTAISLLSGHLHLLPTTVRAEAETEEQSAETITMEETAEDAVPESFADVENSMGNAAESAPEEEAEETAEADYREEEEERSEDAESDEEIPEESLTPVSEETGMREDSVSAEADEAEADSSQITDSPDETAAAEDNSDTDGESVPEAAENESESQDAEVMEQGPAEIFYPAFTDTKTAGGVTVALTAGEGVFPEGVSLSVEPAADECRQDVDAAVENVRAADVTVAVSYTFDIKVLDQDGNEVQPADGTKVTIEFAAAEIGDHNLDAAVYHVADGEAELLEISAEGNAVKAETEGFSFYTVEFTYNTLQYVLSGGTSVELNTILNALGLSGEVTSALSSAPELFSVENQDGEWMVISHHSFDTAETLTVTINGIEYVIEVTDPAETYPVKFFGEQITSENCDDVYHDGGSVKYDSATHTLTLDNPKLKNDISLSVAKALIEVDGTGGFELTITGQAVFDSHFQLADGIRADNSAKLIFDGADIVFDDPSDPIVGTGGASEVTIQNSHIEALGSGGNHDGIYADYITVKSGTVTATGGSGGMLALKGLVIEDGTVDTTGIHVYEGDAVINGGTVTGPIKAGDDYYKRKGNIYINGGTVFADLSKNTDEYNSGLYAYGTIKVGPGITGVIAEGEYAVLAYDAIDIDSDMITEPHPAHKTTGIHPYGTHLTISKSISTADIAEKVVIAPKGTHVVTFDMNGQGTTPEPVFVKDGEKVQKPEDPAETGYTFMGWYTDENYTNLYDFSSTVTANLILYGKMCMNVNGFMIYADGTEADSTYYRLKTTTMKPLFEKKTGEVSIELGHLCTDSGCSDVITAPPVKGTTYYFQVYMKDTSSYETGKQLIMFLPEIKNNIIRSAVEAKLEFEEITGSPSGDAVTLLFRYTEDVIAYTVTKGTDAQWQKGSAAGTDYTIERNINDSKTFSLFESIEVDGTVIAASNYTAASGSLNAALNASYLNKLSAGVHTVKFNFRDGSAETTLTIKDRPKPEKTSSGSSGSGESRVITYLPDTGDSSDPGLWACILLISLTGLTVLITTGKKIFG
ncbi:MAG: hypothetical protein E7190_01805 [Erysipelotrichaceae bacterium]|nr:hypothetical protein [Erysipelotrichaceae bacterium]